MKEKGERKRNRTNEKYKRMRLAINEENNVKNWWKE